MQTSSLQSLAAALFGAVTGMLLCIMSGQGWSTVPLWALIGGTASFIVYQPVVFFRTAWTMAMERWRDTGRLVRACAQKVGGIFPSSVIKKSLTILLGITCFLLQLFLAVTIWFHLHLAYGVFLLPLYGWTEVVCLYGLLLAIGAVITLYAAIFWLSTDGCLKITSRLNPKRSAYLILTRIAARLTGIDRYVAPTPTIASDEWWLNWRSEEGKFVTRSIIGDIKAFALAQLWMLTSPLLVCLPLVDCLLSAGIAVACTKRLAAMFGGAAGTVAGAAVYFSGAQPIASLAVAAVTALAATGGTIGLRAVAQRLANQLYPLST